jgi:hypothetical protein
MVITSPRTSSVGGPLSGIRKKASAVIEAEAVDIAVSPNKSRSTVRQPLGPGNSAASTDGIIRTEKPSFVWPVGCATWFDPTFLDVSSSDHTS